MVDFKSVKLNDNQKKQVSTISEISTQEIAIIGISARFPMADDIDSFWRNIAGGVDCIDTFPKTRRQDADQYLKVLGEENSQYFNGAYLKEIDKFDAAFFRLSPKEASLMSPNQRLFLETAWNAIEDAGYGGKKLLGSQTGVFLGYEADAPYDYKRLIAEVEPESMSFAVPGNLTPIIASRISYLLDFHGPSLSVDTACSSALVAVHLACRAIRNQECNLAIAGSIRLNLLPLRGQLQLGVESSDGRARTFDDASDGTGSGEGVAVVVLKPLSKALKDRDNIYAVIKGSAVNQDGSSIGITAPNVLAQEEVIVNAWKDAGVDPETISCIEAHGTGTRLGDPIEIDGIQRAFRRYTTKKGFCAIGSVKTNIGHLDNAAGMAGLIKMAQALRARQIPPSLHFSQPNRQIVFEQSPVYVNDRLCDWETGDQPRRCGISSFGFSGTNCHLILEEAPPVESKACAAGIQVLSLSAQSAKALKSLIIRYHQSMTQKPEWNVSDLCYTANTGRGHYNFRLAILFETRLELAEKLAYLITHFEDSPPTGVYMGEHKLVPANKSHREPGEYSETQLNEFTGGANQKIKQFRETGKTNRDILSEICVLYVKGAEIDWDQLYFGEDRRRISLPGYPFERKRCWVKASAGHQAKRQYGIRTGLTLLEYQITESVNFEVYATEFNSQKQWVVNEHRIMGNGVLVGTTYLEMAVAAFKRHHSDGGVEISDVVFLAPLALQDGEQRNVQLILRQENHYFEFEVASKLETGSEGKPQWLRHVVGKLKPLQSEPQAVLKPEELKAKYHDGYQQPDLGVYNDRTVFDLGPHWRNLKAMYVGQTELLSYLEMPENFTGELHEFNIHPALMDNALTTIPLLQQQFNYNPQGNHQDLFLPFSYRTFRLYRPLPAKFYSYVRLNSLPGEKAELASFNLCLMDIQGEVLAEIEDYCLKKAPAGQFTQGVGLRENLYYRTEWIQPEPAGDPPRIREGAILLLSDENGLSDGLIRLWSEAGKKVVVAGWGPVYQKLADDRYRVNGSKNDYEALLTGLQALKITQIYHLLSFAASQRPASALKLEDYQKQRGVTNLFHLTQALLDQKVKGPVEIFIVARYVQAVTGREPVIFPENAPLFGLGQVIGREYPSLQCRCIDGDDSLTPEQLMAEFEQNSKAGLVIAFRNRVRYVPEFRPLDLSSLPVHQTAIRQDGVYLITGGTGGIGLEIAKFIAAKQRVKLALLNRSRFPKRKDWAAIVEAGAEPKLCHQIKLLEEIEGNGSKVYLFSVDVAQYDLLQQVIAEIHATCGRINGVIHSAGVAGDGFIINKTDPVWDEVLAPKVQGTWNLDELTRTDSPDFMILFSSVITLTGAPGQGDYTAANAYLDTFAAYRNKTGRKTMTINWAGWQETGMAVDYGVNQDGLF
ncbi:MAG TPA: SDR family NAD(P)-dependent oxidoreductase, partial [Bacillota bacterium]|nr:SDR family NAD(P)-dependent oxidoreductase [Bacillota bacterium]